MQQPLQSSLIGRLILPLTKIANEAYAANIPRPSYIRLHLQFFNLNCLFPDALKPYRV